MNWFEVWITDNMGWMLPLFATLLTFLGTAMISQGIRDHRKVKQAQRDEEEIARISALYSETAVVRPVWSGPKHLPVGEVWEDDLPELTGAVTSDEGGYVGAHRMPENLTAQKFAALFTQTREMPTVRVLAPDWRQAVAV